MSQFNDLTGKVFGRWTVLHRDMTRVGKHPHWVCQCECGTTRTVNGGSLSRGLSVSCGCYHRELMAAKKTHDLTGKVFERLTVLSRASNAPSGGVRWNCHCECGVDTVVLANNLTRGHTRSCGCLFPERDNPGNRTHGLFNEHQFTHVSWDNMKSRCYNPKDSHYHNYGGRGIKVCDRWKDSFENFFLDMGERPVDATLDRKDVNGDYTPENCKWASRKEQARNRTNNKVLTIKGVSRCLSEWSDVLGIKAASLHWFVDTYGDEEGIRRCLARHGKAA